MRDTLKFLLPKPRMGICQKHGTVEAMWVSLYWHDGCDITYRSPDLCKWCYVEAIERMTTHLQPLPEAAAEDEVSHGARVPQEAGDGER